MDLFIRDRSERRTLSRDCLRSSAGFRVMITTVDKIATMAITMRSSMRVKEERKYGGRFSARLVEPKFSIVLIIVYNHIIFSGRGLARPNP